MMAALPPGEVRMLGIVRRLRRPRRHVFAFRLNGRTEYRDPGVIRRKLGELNPHWSELVDAVVKDAKPLPDNLQAAGGEIAAQRAKIAEDGTRELADLASKAFDAPPLSRDGSGLTEPELIDLLAQYLEFCAAMLRATKSFPSPPPASASAGGG